MTSSLAGATAAPASPTCGSSPSGGSGSPGFGPRRGGAALAERVLGDAGFRPLAEGAALDALGPVESGIDLCCGRAGRAYAALALYRATGDERWIDGARA